MELRDYLRILRRRWPIILLSLLATVGAAAAYTARATPLYESTAQLFISTSTSSSSSDVYQGSLASTQRVASYADLVTGKELADRVISAEGLSLDAATLATKVKAEAVPQTVLLNISVTDPSPTLAKSLTSAYAAELSGLVTELETPPGSSIPLLKATVTDSANLPTSPVSPNPVRNLGLALVLGLLLGFGLAVLREVLDTSVKTATDVEEAAQTSVMAGISYDPDTKDHPLVTDLSSHSPRVEAFRVLRTNLQFVDIDSTSKAFVVTSSVPGEGKSTTAVNTAITLAQTGQSILLIDGDLRRPQVASMLDLEGSVGMTTVLVGKVSATDAIQTHQASGLHVLTSGAIPPNPSELLQSQAMKDLLADLRDKFDMIIFDAPPLLPVTDAALLAAQVDGALLVVRHSRTTREQLHGAHERLAGVGAHPMGVVFNMIPKRRGGSYGYGYGYGYGYAPEVALGGVRKA